MANESYNVFELTNALLRESREKETQADTAADKKIRPTVKESVSGDKVRSTKARKPFEIPCNKLKLESLSMFKEADGDDEIEDEVDVTADYTPEDDVVLVIDPEMEEVPEDAAAAAEAAEEMVGDHVCKCSICGANYVTDTEITEETEIEDAECPVCGEVGDQIVVGVITPVGELSDEDSADLDDVDVEEEEDFEEFEDDGEGEDFEEEDFEEGDYEESLNRARDARRAMAQRRTAPVRRTESAKPVRPTRPSTTKRPVTRKPVTEMADGYAFDEVTFNRMLTQFAKENYANVRSVKISSGSLKRGKLTLEGVVTTTKGKKRTIKFVAEDFKPSARMTIKFREIGPFTESIKSSKPSFILECRLSGKAIRPMALRYSYVAKNATSDVRESRARYSVIGKVLSESVKRNTQTRKRRTDK